MSTKDPPTLDYKERRRRELSGEGTGRKRREAKENKLKISHDTKTQNGSIPTETPKDRATRRRRQKDASSNGIVVKSSNESNHKPTKNDKINIVETTPHLLTENNSEKENKQKSLTTQPNSRNSLRKATGSKILDKLSRFEAGDVSSKKTNGSLATGHGNKSSFQRHYTGAFRAATNTEPVTFRRSYRLPRTSAIQDTGSHVRRSLRGRTTTKSVKDSIAKLEGKDSTKTAPPTKPSLAAASRTRIIRDTAGTDGSKISDIQRRLERAEHALEKHKDRLRKTPVKGDKSRPIDKDTPTKTNIRKKLDTADKNKTSHEPKKTSNNAPSASKETTLVAEMTSPSQEKVSLIIKERSVPKEPEQEPVATPEEPKQINLSVGQAVELFSNEAPEIPNETNDKELSTDKHVGKSRRRSRKSIPSESTKSPTKETRSILSDKEDAEVHKVKEEIKTVEKTPTLAKEEDAKDDAHEEAEKLDATKEAEEANAVFEETSVVTEVTLPSKEEVSLVIKERNVPKDPEPENEAVTEAPEEPKQGNLSVGKAVELFSVAEADQKPIETETKKTESSEKNGRRSRRRSRKTNSDLAREEIPKTLTKEALQTAETNEVEIVVKDTSSLSTDEASLVIVKEAPKMEEEITEKNIEAFEEPKKSHNEPKQRSLSVGKTSETLPTEAVVSVADKPSRNEANEKISEDKPIRKTRRRSRKSSDLSREETPKSPTKSPTKEFFELPSKHLPESPTKELSISMKVGLESPTSPVVISPTVDISNIPTEDSPESPVNDTPSSPLKEVASSPTVQETVEERKPSIKEMAKAMDDVTKTQEDFHLTKKDERKTSIEEEPSTGVSDKPTRKTRRRSRKSSSDTSRDEKTKITSKPQSPTKKVTPNVEDTTTVFKDTPAVKPSSEMPSVASSVEPKTRRKSRRKSSEPKAKEIEKSTEIIIIEQDDAKTSETTEVPPEGLDDAIQTLQRLSLEVETGRLQDLAPSASKSKDPETLKTVVTETSKPEAVSLLPETESVIAAHPQPQKAEPAKPTTPVPIPAPTLTKRQLLRKRILANRARMVLKPPIVVVSDDDDDLLLSDASTDELDSDDSWLDHDSDDEKTVSNGVKVASPVKSKFLEADRKVQQTAPANTTPQKLKAKVEVTKNRMEKKSPTKRTPSPPKPKPVEAEKKIAKKTVASETDEEEVSKPKVNAMLSMWEDKAAASKKVETSSPARSPMNIRKLRETRRDAAFVSDSDEAKVQDRSRIKSTLSDMVECDECDIINVKNVKAMWESQFSNTR